MTATEDFIKVLASLKEGDLGLLRTHAGRGLDESVNGFDLFTGLWWPLRKENVRTPERRSAWLLVKLYSAFPLPDLRGENAQLANVLGCRERALRNESDRSRFRLRFDALLQSPLSILEPHLSWALSTICEAAGDRQAEGIGWVRLLDDLRLWVRGPDKQDEDPRRRHRDVRDIWAEQYLTSTQYSHERSYDNVD